MEGIDWVGLSHLAPEVVLVVVFCVFVIYALRLLIGWLDKRDELQLVKDEKRDNAFLAAIASESKEWRDFMNIERKRQADGLTHLANEVSALGMLITATNGLIAQHDAWERTVLENRIKLLEEK